MTLRMCADMKNCATRRVGLNPVQAAAAAGSWRRPLWRTVRVAGRALPLLALAALNMGGCLNPKSNDPPPWMPKPTKPPAPSKAATPEDKKTTLPPPAPDKNVNSVHMLIKQEPWISFKDDANPGGLQINLFLGSGSSDKGVYGDGTIEINMYRTVARRDGRKARVLVKKWEFDPEQALPYLLRRPTAFGWGYGFRLNWGDADVLGKEVMLVTRFIRPDGQIVAGQPKHLKVPPRVG